MLLNPQLESAWRSLRPTLEAAGEFSLVFAFVEGGPDKEALYRRADDLLRANARVMERPNLGRSEDAARLAIQAIFIGDHAKSSHANPLWIDLDGNPHDPLWNAARIDFLIRLNEKRSTLMREHKRLILLCLPLTMTKLGAETAPDLWTIRQPSVRLEPMVLEGVPALDQARNEPSALPKFDELPLAIRRWQPDDAGGFSHLAVWDGVRAFDSALEMGLMELAETIAQQTLTEAQRLLKAGETPERLRDVSVSLDRIGDIASAQGRLEAAQSAHEQGLEFAQRLLKAGETPERLRDVSVSQNKIGDIARAQGRLEAAQSAYEQGLEVRQRLLKAGETPERLRDVLVSQIKIGDIASAQGRLEAAQSAYEQGLEVRQRLLKEGETPERLRDICISFERLATVAERLGNLEAARVAYEEELRYATHLVNVFGESLSSLEVWAFASSRLAHLADAKTDSKVRLKWRDDALAIYRRLYSVNPAEVRYGNSIAELEALKLTHSP
jgi:tetratricopeptide (TPR) repeat protein